MPPLNPMKVVNLAPFARRNSARLTLTQRLKGALQFGWRWFREYPAQERLAELLAEHLDRRFLLVLNFRPFPDQPPFPPILVGPSGVHLFYPTFLRGDFRIREDRLWVYDPGKQRFKPVRPDPIQDLKKWQQQLQALLEDAGESMLQVEARLVFLEPSSYVDVFQAEIQPVMVDGLPRYLEQLIRSRRYRRTQIQQWLEVFLHGLPQRAAPRPKTKGTTKPTPSPSRPAQTRRPQPTARPPSTPPRSRRARAQPRTRARISPRVLFFVLMGLNVFLLLALILVALLLLR